MTTITRRKSMTVDALRERLRKTMARSHDRPCPNCSGTGKVSGPLTTNDVVQGAGIAPSAAYSFLAKGKSLSLEGGLKLLAWLDRLEDPLSELHDEDDVKPISERNSAAERQRLAVNRINTAAAGASIDNINRSPVVRS